MKIYYRLTQPYESKLIDDNSGSNRTLHSYLDEQDIRYSMGADHAADLKKFGLEYNGLNSYHLMRTYTVLLDEHELSAIKLAVDNIQIIKSNFYHLVLNKIRGWFRWFYEFAE